MRRDQLAIAVGWQISDSTGWGLVGLHTSLELMRRDHPVYWLDRPDPLLRESQYREQVAPLLAMHKQLEQQAAQLPEGEDIALPGAAVLHPMTHFFGAPKIRYRGEQNLALVPAEKTAYSKTEIDSAREHFDALLAPSRWALQVLQDAGLDHARLWQQAVDCSLFQPMKMEKLFPGRFVIFAGGKLELRKGQDIIVDAFRRFHERHPEAVLVTNWQSAWPKISANIIEGPWTDIVPAPAGTASIDVNGWAQACGLPEGSHADIGWRHNGELPALLNQADLYISASRCEGATNFGVMEAMACGLPVILPLHTGHMDLLNDAGDNVYGIDPGPLTQTGQGDRPAWHEPDPDALLDAMERAYSDAEGRQAIGRKARLSMQKGWTWRNKTDDLLAIIEQSQG